MCIIEQIRRTNISVIGQSQLIISANWYIRHTLRDRCWTWHWSPIDSCKTQVHKLPPGLLSLCLTKWNYTGGLNLCVTSVLWTCSCYTQIDPYPGPWKCTCRSRRFLPALWKTSRVGQSGQRLTKHWSELAVALLITHRKTYKNLMCAVIHFPVSFPSFWHSHSLSQSHTHTHIHTHTHTQSGACWCQSGPLSHLSWVTTQSCRRHWLFT